MSNTQDQNLLEEHVKGIIATIENGFANDELNCDGEPMSTIDYLCDALEIEYIISSDKQYKAGRVLVAFGGPNIWINTLYKEVEGYWWGSKCILPYKHDAIGLDDALEELYNC